ncbi:CurL C-terminal domain-containing protein, partial [Serratia marcescens]
PKPVRADAKAEAGKAPEVLLLSAQSKAALAELALDYAERLDGAAPAQAARIAAAAAHRRERQNSRLALPLDAGADTLVEALRAVGEGEE